MEHSMAIEPKSSYVRCALRVEHINQIPGQRHAVWESTTGGCFAQPCELTVAGGENRNLVAAGIGCEQDLPITTQNQRVLRTQRVGPIGAGATAACHSLAHEGQGTACASPKLE